MNKGILTSEQIEGRAKRDAPKARDVKAQANGLGAVHPNIIRALTARIDMDSYQRGFISRFQRSTI